MTCLVWLILWLVAVIYSTAIFGLFPCFQHKEDDDNDC